MRGSKGSKAVVLPTRKRWKADDARRIFAAWEASGEPLAEFARGAGVDPQRLERWRRRLERTDRSGSTRPAARRDEARAAFVPATILGSVAVTHYAAVVSCGKVRIEVRDPELVPPAWLADVVKALSSVSS